MRVLVTGGSGFIGRHLCRALIAAEHHVRVLTRQDDIFGLPDTATILRIDNLSASTPWMDILGDVDAVIHLAARTHVISEFETDPMAAYRKINVDTTRHLARSAVSAGVKRFIFISSIKVNGEMTKKQPFSIDDVPAPSDPYGITKMEAEFEIARAAEGTEMSTVILRPPLVYGEGVRGNFLSLMTALAERRWLPLGSISNRRSLLYVGNLTSAILTALENLGNKKQIFLLRDGEDMSTTELCRRLAKALGAKANLIPAPPFLLHLCGFISGKSPAITKLTTSLEINDSPIRRELDWKPEVTVDQGLALTAAWYKSRVIDSKTCLEDIHSA